MKNFSKKIIVFLLTISSLFLGYNQVSANSIYDLVDSHSLADGVRYEKIQRLTKSGWLDINIVRIDMTNEDTSVKGLISNKGVSTRETVTNLTNQNNALAGINGDFFNYSPVPNPVGGMINDGEIIVSPEDKQYSWPAFMVDKDNIAKSIILDRTMTAKSMRSAGVVKIDMINKTRSVKNAANLSAMYTDKWASSSPGNTLSKNVTEIVVDNDIVTHIRKNQGPVQLKKDRYVIHLRGSYNNQSSHFQIGDTVSLETKTVPGLENIKFLIGGSSQILKDGSPTQTHHVIAGNHPRTGIGVSKDGSEMILATVDGRNSNSKGVSQKEFGNILKSLGMYDAVNLDGGGSTTMAVKKTNDSSAKLVNKPSDGGQRKVANGVGAFNNSTKGELKKIKIDTIDSNMFVDSRRDFVVKGLDGHLDDVKIDTDKVKLSVEGVKGQLDGSTFKALESGRGKVVAKYEDYETSLDIRVLNNPQAINPSQKKFNLAPGEKKLIKPMSVTDGNGLKALVEARDFELDINKDLGEVKDDGYFYAKENASGSGAITVKFKNAVNSILFSIGSSKKEVQGFGNINDLTFESYPSYVNGSLSANSETKVGKNSIKLSYDFTKGNDTRAAYMTFKKPIKIEKDTISIGFWAKGDKNYSSLKGILLDQNKKEHYVTFKELIDFDNWQYVRADLPEDINFESLNKIYVAETSKVASHEGSILIDGLSLESSPTYENIKVPTPTKAYDEKNRKASVEDGGFSFVITKAQDSLNKITGRNALGDIQNLVNQHQVAIMMDQSPASFTSGLKNKLVINSGSPFFLGKDYNNTLFLNINSKAGGIRSQSAAQWDYIKKQYTKF